MIRLSQDDEDNELKQEIVEDLYKYNLMKVMRSVNSHKSHVRKLGGSSSLLGMGVVLLNVRKAK